MRRTRVIPIILIHNNGVYKTTKFTKPVYIGDPINAIRLFNDLEVDEICVLDIDASKLKSGPNFELLADLASEAFMPFSYGGGISTVEHAKQVLNYGIEKVIINHALRNDPQLITRLSTEIGSQSIIASIDYKKKFLAGDRPYDHVTGDFLPSTIIDEIKKFDSAGAGEILITSIDRDGSMSGLDIETISEISKITHLPVISCGGAGTLDHLSAAELSGTSAIAGGSMFVYHGKQRGILINYPSEKDLRLYLS